MGKGERNRTPEGQDAGPTRSDIRKSRDSIYCDALPTKPNTGVGSVLVTGATGYIGGRLVPELVARGYDVRVMVRADAHECDERFPGAEVVCSDALEPSSLKVALEGVHTAYYLIHSMLLGPADFARADVEAAVNFRRAAEASGVSRIIYLGGLGDSRKDLSKHLRSRLEVADALRGELVPVTFLRAAIIIGAGSASYEIIKHLVQRLPLLLIPRWAENTCQPIAVCDVIKYLVACLEVQETAGGSFDIGGTEVLSYREMLETTAELLQLRRVFIPIPFPWLAPYAYVASLVTPVPAAITRCLMESLRNEVVCQERGIGELIPLELARFSDAIVAAMTREEQDRVRTRWSDAYPPAHELALKLHELQSGPRYTAAYSISSDKATDSLYDSVCRIGGREGWFHNNWMWWLRGVVDRLLLGVGSSRGRKNQMTLRASDVIDFWRVEDLQPNKRLLLRAEMKLPGKAWLEFVFHDPIETRRLEINAYFDTDSLFGRAYWYFFLPFHDLIFKDLLEQIEARA